MNCHSNASTHIPFPLKRLMARLGIWLMLAAGILYGVIVWWCASEIAEPTRRLASAVHQPFFDGTAKAGFTVEKFQSSDGMPFLLCVPAHSKELSKKATIIRSQLKAKGVELKSAGEIVGTLLILHGRTGIKEDYLPVAERFCAVGFRCLIPDLPGHGSNPERFTTYGLLEAPMILKGYHEAAAEYNFAGEPCMLFGQSMGGSEAIYSAARKDSPFSAMVIASSFDELDTVIRGQTNQLLGSIIGSAVRGSADSVFEWKTGVKISEIKPIEQVSKIRIPSLILHGEADKMISRQSAKALYDAIPESVEKQWLVVPNAGHNNILITDYPLYATMAEWFLKHMKP